MNHGFWDDEELNVRTTLVGKIQAGQKDRGNRIQALRLA